MRQAVVVLITVGWLAGCKSADTKAAPDPTTKSAAGPDCTFCPVLSEPKCTLCVEANPLLVVDKDGAATGVLHLCNRGPQPVKLALTISDFHAVSPEGQRYPLSAVRTLSPATPAGKTVLEGTPLAVGQCVDIKVDGAKIWQAGLLSAELKNNTEKVIDLKAVRYQVPFNVKVDGPTPEKVDVLFTRGKESRIRLRNEDPMAYRFRWRLEAGDAIHGGEISVAPNQIAEIPITLDPASFPFLATGFLRGGTEPGTLVLDYEPDPSFRVLPLPAKRYPVTAHLNYWGPTGQRIWNFLSILVVLLIGIAISLLINFALPVQKRRIRVKQRMADLEGRLAGLGDTVDSRILGLLRVEKKRLREELRELWPVFPTTDVELPKLETRIDWLAQRIDLTVKAGESLAAIELESDVFSLPEIEQIRSYCTSVLDVVRKPSPPQAEIKSAEDYLLLVANVRSNSRQEPTPEAVQALLQRAAAVTNVIPSAPPANSPWEPFTELLQALQKDLPQASQPQTSRMEHIRNAKAVRKMELVVEFVELVEAAPCKCVRDQRFNRAGDLLKALQPGPDESIEEAQDVVRQADQNVTTKDVETEIGSGGPGSLWIEVDPPTPLPYQLVIFRVRLRRPGLDTAVARKEIPCSWKIDGTPLQEASGWLVATFFPAPETWLTSPLRKLKAKLRRVKPKETFDVEAQLGKLAVPAHPVRLEHTKSYVESRTLLALGTLLITLLIVGLGLLAGAQEKLQALDWVSGLVAVLALGFGADTLKNLLAKSS